MNGDTEKRLNDFMDEAHDHFGKVNEFMANLKENVLPTFQTRSGCEAAMAGVEGTTAKASLALIRARTWEIILILTAAGVGALITHMAGKG